MANTFKRIYNVDVDNASLETIYTVSGVTAIVKPLYITNKSTTQNAQVSIVISVLGATDVQVVKNVDVPLGSTLVLEDGINLEDTDVLKAQADLATTLDIYGSVLEIG